MKALVLGGGGREHAIAWKLLDSERVSEIVCAPGSAGMCAERAEGKRVVCAPVDLGSVDDMVRLAIEHEPGITIVGPEQPLALGVVDEFERRGWRIFGPTAAAARLEGSKAYAKEFMQRHKVPTAHYAVCTSEQEVQDALKLFRPPVVVKADGLAAGKGVIIAASREEAARAAAEMLGGRMLAGAGRRLVLEEFLEGEELSFLCVSDGEHVAALAPAQDHKRIGEGDTGANTGGMGAYSCDALLAAEMREWILAHVAGPVIAGMAAEGTPFKGVLYCGLMMTARGPMVLEFNARFGDPETQPILMRLESDLLDVFEAAIDGRLAEVTMRWRSEAALGVVMASGGYPEAFAKGKAIRGIAEADALPQVKVFHAGTARQGGEIVTSGGRVLCVTALGEGIAEAARRAYEGVSKIHFEGSYFRRDIGHRALRAK